MNGFDKFCAFFAFLLGLGLLMLGVIGLFTGCRAYFTLPPVAGVIPAFVGWGILRAVYVAWNPQSGPVYEATPFEMEEEQGPSEDVR